jgi:GAF domain-containing protein
MAGGSNGYRAALAMRQLTPGLISSLPETAGLPPFISSSTSYLELGAVVCDSHLPCCVHEPARKIGVSKTASFGATLDGREIRRSRVSKVCPKRKLLNSERTGCAASFNETALSEKWITAGIAGRVALTGKPVNVPDAYSHPDFNPSVDESTGYRTRSILCAPIFDRSKQVFAVAQLINRLDGQPFGPEAETAFQEFIEPLGLILEGCIRLHAQAIR